MAHQVQETGRYASSYKARPVFYKGRNSIIAEQLKKHAEISDLVATISLIAEHMTDLRRAITSNMSSAHSIIRASFQETSAHKLRRLQANDATVFRSEKGSSISFYLGWKQLPKINFMGANAVP